jgi:hypothetical protein
MIEVKIKMEKDTTTTYNFLSGKSVVLHREYNTNSDKPTLVLAIYDKDGVNITKLCFSDRPFYGIDNDEYAAEELLDALNIARSNRIYK